MEKLISKENLLKFIPQRPPMVMVDALLSSDEATLTAHTSFFIEASNIFCKANAFKEPGLIENIAQSCALRAGYTFHSKNEKVPLGFIGAIKDLNIHFFPEASTKKKNLFQLRKQSFFAKRE